jgi:succinoglycan biosynthesis protein ExoM
MSRVAICIATSERPVLLRNCLRALVTAVSAGNGHNVVIVVVENGESLTSQVVIEEVRTSINIIYELEKKKGIPFARNRCLDLALNWNADYIAFVDDDVEVDPNWFVAMMKVIEKLDVDVVSGDVRYVAGDRIFDKYGRRPSPRTHAETDNVLFKSWLAEKLRFDERYAFSGGSDYLFFKQAHALGAVIVVALDASAEETLHLDRQTLRWNLRRHFRYGLVGARVDRQLGNRVDTVRIALRSSINVVLGFLEALARLVVTPNRWSLGLLRVSRGLGGIAFLLGIRFDEYRRS